MNQNEQLSFIDLLSIMSFCIGLMNLEINITQEDVDNQTQTILNELHGHLEIQDKKLDNIIQRLEELENGKESNAGGEITGIWSNTLRNGYRYARRNISYVENRGTKTANDSVSARESRSTGAGDTERNDTNYRYDKR